MNKIRNLSILIVVLITLLAFSSVSFARDDNPPTGRISIVNATILGDGTQAVATRDVSLEIYAYDANPGVSRIALVNENNMTPIDWINWTDSSLVATGEANKKRKTWQLSPNDGMKTVYLLVEDADGNTTVTYNDAYRYYITYNLKGGSNGPSQGEKEVGKPYTISSTVPTKTYYDFLGWDTASAGTKADYVGGDKYYKNADITLYAYWQPHYTIVFNGNGNTGGSTANQEMTYSIAKNLRANGFTKTGYLFSKWNTAANGSGTSYNNQQSVNNLTSTPGGTFNLYAQWTPITYTIAYNKGTATSGTLPSNHTGVKYDQSVTLGTNSMNKSNTNLGTVTFNYNGSGAANTTSTAYTSYAVNGWSLTSGGSRNYTSGQTVSNLTATNGGTVTLYPCFSSTAHSAVFPNPSRTGYVFEGWYTAASGGTKVTSYIGTSNVTYYAHWTPITYTIAFNANGGSGSMSNMTMTYNVAKNLTSNAFSRTNYTYVGWNTKSDWSGTNYSNGQSVNNLTITNGTTITLYAKWAIARINSTYYPTIQSAVNAAASGQTVVVLGNTTESTSIPSGKNITIDLNGKTVSYGGCVFSNAGTVTMTNGTIVGSGNTQGTAVSNSGNMTLNSVTITSTENCVLSRNSITINNCTLNCNSDRDTAFLIRDGSARANDSALNSNCFSAYKNASAGKVILNNCTWNNEIVSNHDADGATNYITAWNRTGSGTNISIDLYIWHARGTIGSIDMNVGRNNDDNTAYDISTWKNISPTYVGGYEGYRYHGRFGYRDITHNSEWKLGAQILIDGVWYEGTATYKILLGY